MKLKTITKKELESLLKSLFALWGISTIGISIIELIGVLSIDYLDMSDYTFTLWGVTTSVTLGMLLAIGKYLCQEDKADDVSDTAEPVSC